MTEGRTLPKEVVDCWPEVFGEVKLNVLPLRYLHAVLITFKDGKIWEVKISKDDHSKGWQSLEETIGELYKKYESRIDNIDFRLDTQSLKKDIEKGTQKFLKKKKL